MAGNSDGPNPAVHADDRVRRIVGAVLHHLGVEEVPEHPHLQLRADLGMLRRDIAHPDLLAEMHRIPARGQAPDLFAAREQRLATPGVGIRRPVDQHGHAFGPDARLQHLRLAVELLLQVHEPVEPGLQRRRVAPQLVPKAR
jgi:hypothetical protein